MQIDQPKPLHIPQLRQLWQEVFGDSDAFLDSFFRTAFAPDHCRCLFLENQPVCMLYWIDCTLKEQTLAYLYAVATHPDHRGQGLCRRLMENTHALLRSQGYAGVLLVPQDSGLRIMYGKLGYKNTGGLQTVSCNAASFPLPLRALGPSEFAILRRQLLPEGGVVQEGAGLDFLAEQLQFYAGDDFLLAGFAENGIFHGIELLGNPAAAGCALNTLGCQSGDFHIPGTDPFAMFHPLAACSEVPTYLGFAFD